MLSTDPEVLWTNLTQTRTKCPPNVVFIFENMDDLFHDERRLDCITKFMYQSERIFIFTSCDLPRPFKAIKCIDIAFAPMSREEKQKTIEASLGKVDKDVEDKYR